MTRHHNPYPAEFRAQMVGLVVKAGRGVDSSGVHPRTAAVSLLTIPY
ncbi:hypothetical protein PSP31121_05660 [Pandoraea sputorum]|uniref:Transposase n=1 Tax=Pandoraea sputorum TaxID=93222 RepID=A0A5E5BIG2_9BURK|nr:hypothetical protein PSP31121_05660 [Pandoraea sputorum]